MKGRLLIAFALLIMGASLCVAQYAWPYTDDAYWAMVEELEESNYLEHCYSGGYNATSCSIDAGISIGGGVSLGCSVTCNSKSYACCGLECKCVNYTEIEINPGN